MKFFSRWSRKKEGLRKRAEQRVQSEEKKPVAVPEAEAIVENEPVKPGKYSEAACRLLLKPLVTEKASNLQSAGVYCFAVHDKANKNEIKKAVETVFGVKVIKVRIINCRGKLVRYGRISGRRKHWKKAMVTLRSGDRIEIHKNV